MEKKNARQLYLMKILLEQTDEDNALTLQQLIEKMGAEGIPIERRAVYADLEALRDFGIDVISEKRGRNTYYYVGNRQFQLAELKLLVDSVLASRFITERKSRELIKKLADLAGKPQAKELNRQVLIAGRIKSMNESIYYNVDEIHEPIIDQKMFDRVQEEIARRKEMFDYGNSIIAVEDRHPLSTRITCGICGKHYIRKFANSKSKYKAPIWICQTFLRKKKTACPSRRISEKVLFPILAGVLGVQEEDVLDESSRIEKITIFPDGRLIIQADGEMVERCWENPSRALSWTQEMKLEAAKKERKRQECLKQQYAKGE